MSKPNESINDSTTVEEVDVNLDDIFGVGADNVLLPAQEKKSIFTKETVDTSFIDKPDDTTIDDIGNDDEPAPAKPRVDVTAEIDELDKLINEGEEIESKGGRPKLDKSGLLEIATKMIEEGSLMPFDDDKLLEDYTASDFRELFEVNFQEREDKVKAKVPQEFFASLPRELQVAAKYVADGGQDLKGLFRTLAQVEEVFELDPSNEAHQEEIARQYLYATQFGNPEEIEAEIEDWKDLDRLGKKAEQFKPKLDKMQEEIVARRLAEQEVQKQRQEQAAQAYTENVYNTLVEPRHDLIAEALWLLQDPEGYRNKIKTIGSTQATAETVRKLKTAEGQRAAVSGGTRTQEQEPSRKSQARRTIERPSKNIFSR